MKKSNGVTLISLIITIIVLIIIAGIAIRTGKEVVRRAQLEELRTNMLLIQAKAKEYVELANFKIGIKPTDETKMQEYEAKKASVREEVYVGEAKLQKAGGTSVPTQINITDNFYKVTEEALQAWGLDKIETSSSNMYLIEFDDTNAKVEIYNTKGYKGLYSLTEIDEIEQEKE